jgi:hypothetical protein
VLFVVEKKELKDQRPWLERLAETNLATTSFTSVGNEADRIQRHKPLAASTI